MFHGKELQPKNKISARDYNEIRKKVMNMDQDRITAQSHHTPNPVIVRVRNVTDQILPEFSIVGIKTPMYPKDNKTDFNNQGTAYGVELEARPWDSAANDHEAQDFGIITRKLAPDSLGYAVIAGPSPVQVTHYNPDYPYALPQNNNTATMRAMPFGPAKIIWIDTEHPSELDEEVCDPTPRNAYIDIQNQQWWQFFELQEPLEACSSADSIACYHCGGQIGPCEIHRTIWLPRLGCEDDGSKLPAGTIVLAHWFEQENKWIAIEWRQTCPDFDEFEPSDSDLIHIDTPVEFEYIVGDDPCVDGCDVNLVFVRKTLYHNDCGALCEYDTGSVRIPFNPPTFPGWVPVSCIVDDSCHGDGSDSSSICDDESESGSCECTSRRYVHVVYPEMQIGCGSLCFTGNTIIGPGCDISLTQETPLTHYDSVYSYSEGSPCDDSSDSGGCGNCGSLTITRRRRDSRIVCDNWCESDWQDVETVSIPVVACDGGSITYVDNVHLSSGSECGCLSLVIDYATADVRCGAVCSPTITSSQPIQVCLNGETKDVEVVTGVTGTIDISGGQKTVVSDVALDLSNLELIGTSESVITGVSFDVTKLTLTGGTAQTVVSNITYTAPTLSSTSVSIPTVSGATLDESKLALTGTNVNVLTGASITPVAGSLSYGTNKTVLTDVELDDTKLTVSVPLTLVTGGTVSGNLTISIPMKKKQVVTDVSVDGCEIIGTKEDVWVLNPSNPKDTDTSLDISVSVTGLRFTPSSTTYNYPGIVSLASGFLTPIKDSVTQPNGVNITGGVLTKSDTNILSATGISAQSDAISLTAGTAVSAVGSVSLTNGSVSESTASITIPTGVESSQTPLSTTTATVFSATGLSGQGGITQTKTTVTDAGSATFTADVTKKRLTFNHGVLCGSGGEEESDSGSN